MQLEKRRTAHYSRDALFLRCLVTCAMAMAPVFASAQADPAFPTRVEARVLSLVNELRAGRGLAALEPEPRLEKAAADFARHMARTGVLEHDADGRTPAARAKQRGYTYCVISENIAYEYNSRGFSPDALARNLVDGWRDSPTHRENILDPAVTQTGLGIARNERGEFYAAQLFARPVIAGARKGAACRR